MSLKSFRQEGDPFSQTKHKKTWNQMIPSHNTTTDSNPAAQSENYCFILT